MPKVTNKCKSRSRINALPSVSIAFSAPPPRKVSFEDGQQCGGDAQSSSDSMTVLEPLQHQPNSLSRKSTMVRPKSSLSLVELAKTVEEDQENSNLENASVSAPVSPTYEFDSSDPRYKVFPRPSSPWGQFVDMVSPEASSQSHYIKHACAYGRPCSCSTSCRRKRSSPYGVYKRARKSAPSRAFTNPINLVEDLDWEVSLHSFRLSPRRSKEPTEQLVGELGRLSVD